MSAGAPRPDAEPEASRLPTLLWLACRFLPPLDRRDQRMLLCIVLSCAYLALSLTVGLTAVRMPSITLVSLLCLSAPALPAWWWGAVVLGERRRETVLALRQMRIDTHAATATALSKLIAYPTAGAVAGAALITAVHRPLARMLPRTAPLAVAVHSSAGRWLLAAPAAAALLVALTALLSSARSAACLTALRRLVARIENPEAAPQPQ